MLPNEKRVIIRNKRLKKLRNDLREILIKAVYDEIDILSNYSSLYGAILDLTPEEQREVFFLEGTKHKLFSLMRKSICKCPVCMHIDRDMVFIPLHEMWFCTKCQDEDRIWYHPQGSEEDRRQHDYINYYYEQKEKFAKRFLSKGNKDKNK